MPQFGPARRGFMRVDFIEITLGIRVTKKDPMFPVIQEALRKGGRVKLSPNGQLQIADGRPTGNRLSKMEGRAQQLQEVLQRQGSITAAAEALDVTPAAVYGRIKKYRERGLFPNRKWPWS